jgi:2-polyprenyl-3-methyl-5-hydroxy-6-metoxy-1,4-benzoquinol methylase
MDTVETRDAGPSAPGSVAFSCVVDKDPFLIAQCFVWLYCLTELQSLSPDQIFVHHTELGNREFLDWLRCRGVNLVKIEQYDERSPYCNKLRQLRTFCRRKFERVVLMDCDTAWVGRVALPCHAPVAAKISDLASPPEPVLAQIFRAAGVGDPDWVEVSFPADEPGWRHTDRNYCNGGLYILSGDIIPQLDLVWRKWANWCLKRPHLFGEFAAHADQVSFALALREMQLHADHLSLEWNYPLHFPAATLPDIAPQILHFHRQFGPHFEIQSCGVPTVDQTIDALNKKISEFLGKHFINTMFWDLRYKIAPELGSGIGSRGDILEQKRKWLDCALMTFAHKRVVDIGCGDLETMRELPLTHYRGFDVSRQAIAIARSKRPDWQFKAIEATRADWDAGDVVICLDVLIHQKRRSDFEELLGRLIASARDRLIVSGYNRPPHNSSDIVAFHRPLIDALKESNAFSEISILGHYRDLSLVVADKRRGGSEAHPNDIEAGDFNEASSLTPRPDLLRALADLSRETFGFYTKQFSRGLEYPWIAQKLEALPPGQRAVDIGAGLNPLPLFLARRGAFVDCIDFHPLARAGASDAGWNEWGFFDYSRCHPHLRSHNVDALQFAPAAPVDVVYSVSVIEHMPRATWQALLMQCRQWLRDNGRLLLTIDLIPGTQFLWNYSEGQEVEPPGVHGDIDAFAAQLGIAGFQPIDAFVWKDVPKSRTDLLFIECTTR